MTYPFCVYRDRLSFNFRWISSTVSVPATADEADFFRRAALLLAGTIITLFFTLLLLLLLFLILPLRILVFVPEFCWLPLDRRVAFRWMIAACRVSTRSDAPGDEEVPAPPSCELAMLLLQLGIILWWYWCVIIVLQYRCFLYLQNNCCHIIRILNISMADCSFWFSSKTSTQIFRLPLLKYLVLVPGSSTTTIILSCSHQIRYGSTIFKEKEISLSRFLLYKRITFYF
jgi:hypothetical protein